MSASGNRNITEYIEKLNKLRDRLPVMSADNNIDHFSGNSVSTRGG